MKRLSCKTVKRQIPDYQLGELSEREQAAIKVHLAVCDECREVAEVWEMLPQATRKSELPRLSPLVERRLLAGRMPPGRAALPAVIGPRRLLGVAALAAAAAVAVVVAWSVDTEPPSPGADPVVTAPEPGSPERGEADASGGPQSLAVGRLDGAGIEFAPGSRVWATAESIVCVTGVGPEVARLHVERGLAVIDVDPDSWERRVVVTTPAGEAESRGAVFSVEVAPGGHETLRVTAGDLEVRDHAETGSRALVGEGEQAFRGQAPPPAIPATVKVAVAPARTPTSARDSQPSAPTIEQLLKQVRTERRERRYADAAATYRRIIAGFPGSRTAANALVGLGQLELAALGRPGGARGHFEAYLSGEPAGMLAEEARAGLVRALDRLGRRGEAISAATEYLERHPGGGSAAEMLRRRGDARRRSGSCRQATSDYRRVIDRWPGSREAARAASGLDVCNAKP